MTILNIDYVDKITNSSKKSTSRLKIPKPKTPFTKITHLQLNNRKITGIDIKPKFASLTVIYLYNNNLTTLEGLDFAPNLIELNVQNNDISEIDHLSNLRQLRRLNIGENQISLIENLRPCEDLRELFMESQKMEKFDSIFVDISTVQLDMLTVLNLSGNNLTNLTETNITIFYNLKNLSLTSNCLSDVKDLMNCVSQFSRLEELDCTDNEVVKKPKYKERMTISCPKLELLDGEEITLQYREFIENWTTQIRRKQRSIEENNRDKEKMKLNEFIHVSNW
ncbi:hypothetical protein SNEBB_008823 [Seison nebaliae]|nr:hypothetical protein SNEBB_008823 [Seison nebaliae]